MAKTLSVSYVIDAEDSAQVPHIWLAGDLGIGMAVLQPHSCRLYQYLHEVPCEQR